MNNCRDGSRISWVNCSGFRVGTLCITLGSPGRPNSSSSVTLFSSALSSNVRHTPLATASSRLSFPERAALGIALVEIPLQIDKYMWFSEEDANQGAVAGLNLSVATVGIVVLYFLWMTGAAVRRDRATSAPVLGVPMIAYMAVVTISSLVAEKALLSFFDIALLLQAYALFFYIANRVTERADIIFCVVVLAVTMLIQSFFIFGLTALGSGAAGNEYTFGPLLLAVWPDGRPAGSMHSPVSAGSVLALLWTPVVALGLCRVTGALRVLMLQAAALGLLAILLTQTRGAILTALVGAILIGSGMLLRGWLPRWVLLAVLGLALMGAYPMFVVFEKRVMHGDDGSAESRVHLSAIAMEMIAERPLFGYGAGNCHLAGQRFANSGRYRSEWYYTIHCKYLLVWVENGVLGLIAFVMMLINGLRYGWVAWLQRDRLLAPLGLAFSAAIAGHMVHMSVDIFNSRTVVQLLWVVLGITAAIYKLSLSQPVQTARTGVAHVQ